MFYAWATEDIVMCRGGQFKGEWKFFNGRAVLFVYCDRTAEQALKPAMTTRETLHGAMIVLFSVKLPVTL